MLERTLLAGETVAGEYDFYFVERSNLFGKYYWIYVACTLGMYLLADIFYRLAVTLMSICASSGLLCFRRGKMVITSKGRIIMWELSVSQRKHADARVHYELSHVTNICTVRDLRQMTVRYMDSRACSGVYYTGVEMSFHGFDHSLNMKSKYLRSGNAGSFISAIESIQQGGISSTSLDASNPFVIRVISDGSNKVYKATDNIGFQTVEDVLALNKGLMDVLGKFTPNATKKAGSLFQWSPDCFVTTSQTYASRDSAFSGDKATGIKDSSSDVGGITLVHEKDNFEITFPARWLPLSPGEEIISATGRVPKFTCWDAFMTLITLGGYSCYHTKTYTALVLTTRRVAEVDLKQNKGIIPSDLQHFQINVKSLFPGQVKAGYIRSNTKLIESAISTSGGQVIVCLPTHMASFAQRMHSSHTRGHALDTGIPACLPAAFRPAIGDNSDSKFNATDKAYLPLLTNETLLYRYEAGTNYGTPCCSIGVKKRGKHALCGESVFCCTFPAGPFRGLLVALTSIVTCGDKPVPAKQEILVTSNSLFYTSFDAKESCCAKKGDPAYFVSWVPVRSVRHQRSEVNSAGAHIETTIASCCIVPDSKGPSSYEFTVGTSAGFNIQIVKADEINRNYTKDPVYNKLNAVIGAVQAAIMMEDAV